MTSCTDPETYLRLACERVLLSPDRQRSQMEGNEVAVIGRALVAGGLLADERVQDVLEEYVAALGIREQSGWWNVRRTGTREARRRLSAQRVVVCNIDFDDADERITLERMVFADDATHLDLSGTGPSHHGRSAGVSSQFVAGRSSGPSGLGHRQPLTICDDRGTTATASPGHSSSSNRHWEAHFTTSVPLSTATEWIEIDGVRLQLPEKQPPPPVRVEAVDQVEPVRAMLYGEILGARHRHGRGGSLEVAVQALVATGALTADDPLLAEVERVAAAYAGGTAAPNLPLPWAALLRRPARSVGPLGSLPIGAVVEELEGYSIRFDSLESEEDSFSIALAVSPGLPLLVLFPGLRVERSPIDWWAEDDRDNVYLLVPGGAGGSGEVAEGTIHSTSSLDPEAKELRLLPTGTRERAVVTIPLDGLGVRS
jgi:hypothetical protein